MSRKSGDTPGALPLVLLSVVAVILLGGLIWYTQRGPSPRYDQENPPDVHGDQTETGVSYQALVYKDGQLVAEKKTAPVGSDPVVESVNSVLGSIPAVAPESRLLETKRDGDNLLLVFSTNFSQTYGTDDEAAVIKGVMAAVSKNSTAKTVTFELDNGVGIDTLGNVDLTGPLTVSDWLD